MGGDARLNFDQFNERSRVSSIVAILVCKKETRKALGFHKFAFVFRSEGDCSKSEGAIWILTSDVMR